MDKNKSWSATPGELRRFQRPSKERDRGAIDAVRDKVGAIHYAGQKIPINRKKYGQNPTKTEIEAAKEGYKRLNQSGDVSYGYTGRENTGKPYDSFDARKARDSRSNQASQGKKR